MDHPAADMCAQHAANNLKDLAEKAEQARKIQEVTSTANDLSGLVKKRKAKAVVEEEVAEGKGKKAKVEEEDK